MDVEGVGPAGKRPDHAQAGIVDMDHVEMPTPDRRSGSYQPGNTYWQRGGFPRVPYGRPKTERLHDDCVFSELPHRSRQSAADKGNVVDLSNPQRPRGWPWRPVRLAAGSIQMDGQSASRLAPPDRVSS